MRCLFTSTDSISLSTWHNFSAERTGAPHIIPKSRAIRRAPRLQASALSANFWSCSLTLAGGPRSNNALGAGRSSSISLTCVALENKTYKCSHQTSSSISVSAPVGGKRAQDDAGVEGVPSLICIRLLFESLSNRHAHEIIDTLDDQRAASKHRTHEVIALRFATTTTTTFTT